MKLPNGTRAVVDWTKLAGYCLNPAHPTGRNKARVFASALGITAAHAGTLHRALLDAAASGDAIAGDADAFGQRYTLDFEMTGPDGRRATVRSGWIVLAGEDFPRLTTCYVL